MPAEGRVPAAKEAVAYLSLDEQTLQDVLQNLIAGRKALIPLRIQPDLLNGLAKSLN